MKRFEPGDAPPSRTKRKQQAKEIERLAERIVALPDNQFAQLDLPQEITAEAVLARSTRGRSSHRRQVKHVAGLLRKTEGVQAAVNARLDDLDQVVRTEKRQFHQLEDLRDRLCRADDFDAAFAELLQLAPDIDRKAMARLARSTHEHEDRRAAREIFRRLRDSLKTL